MVRGRLVTKSLLPLRPRLLVPHHQSRLPHRNLQLHSHHLHLAPAHVFYISHLGAHCCISSLPKSRRSENSSYSTVFMGTSLFCAVIQVIIFILASRDTMRCYGEDDDDHKSKKHNVKRNGR